MCIAFIKKSKLKTIVLFNRDESYLRQTSPMTVESCYIAGRDIKAGGTWLAVDKKSGNFSFVTNIRDKSLVKDDKKSRGEIPLSLLSKENVYGEDYNPFNAIVGDKDSFFYQNYLMNKPVPLVIEKGGFGISNEILPSLWPKIELGKKKLDELDEYDSNENLIPKLLDLMGNSLTFDFTPIGTGFSKEQEHLLSSIFIKSRDYGTVSTTILIYEKKTVAIFEKDYINKVEFYHQLRLED